MKKSYKKRTKQIKEERQILLDIGRLDDSLRGVAYIGAKRYAVSGALPKEKVAAIVTKTENNVSYAEVKSVLEVSPYRVESPCKYFPRCGGCQLLHMDYEAGTRFKTALLRKRLLPLGFKEVSDCVSAGKASCRNKVHIAFGKKSNGIDIGFFDDNSHKVINTPSCPMHCDWYTDLVRILREWVTEFGIFVYEPRTLKGHLRFAAARCLHGNIMLTIVSTISAIKNLDELYNMLKVRFQKVSLWLNVNAEKTNEVMAGKLKHIAGDKKLSGNMLGVNFELGPKSFFQVNESMAETIYSKVVELIKESGAECVIDAYSGIGITSALFAKTGIEVISVEIVPEAVQDARALCRNNKVSGVTHICGDITKILPTLRPQGKTAFFVDPPRAGLGDEVAKTVSAFAPETILYLSCNPASLARDLYIFCDNGYQITSVTPYDMFPNTKHLETLVCMTRKS